MVKPPGRCIFCGRHGLSKEHIWSEWTYKLVPKVPGAERELLVIHASPAGQTQSRKRRPGNVHAIKLRKVCKTHCNSGWMSGLDDAVQPILTPLILGEPSTLDTEDQQIVAAWLSMKIMVAEFNRPVDVSTSQSERQFLMRERKPPDRWKIWLGQLSGTYWRTAYYRHSSTLGLALGPIPPKRPLGKNAQSVTIGIGAVIAHLVATPTGIDFDLINEMRQYLVPIWPITTDVIWPPPAILTDRDAERVATVMERTLSQSIRRWIP